MSMKRLTMRLVQTSSLAALALCVGLALPPQARAQTTGADAVRSLYTALLHTMHNGAALGARGRYAQIEPVVSRVFDVPLMTRLAVGPAWSGLNDGQRQQVTQAFGRYIAAVYAERFDSFSGERLQVTGEQQSTGGPIIQSVIVKSDGESVNVNYLMRQTGGTWQIADVYLNGTISELATRRSEFASILRSRGVDGLIATLNGKAVSFGAAHTS